MYIYRSSIPSRQHSKSYVDAVVYEYYRKYIAKYIRNILLSRKQILKKTQLAFDTNDR